MRGARHTYENRIAGPWRKGTLLSGEERATAARLKRCRFSAQEIARAIGRSIPEVEDFLNSPEAAHA